VGEYLYKMRIWVGGSDVQGGWLAEVRGEESHYFLKCPLTGRQAKLSLQRFFDF
jgi:hypothetical protein